MQKTNDQFCLSGRRNRLFVIIACLLIVAGYLLMLGPATDTAAFCPSIFSTRRIVIAPAFCLSGYLLMVVAIVLPRKSK